LIPINDSKGNILYVKREPIAEKDH
jgi:hypothetical protein